MQHIGVHDMDGLLDLLTDSFNRAFPGYGPTDYQNMIQMLTAAAMENSEASHE